METAKQSMLKTDIVTTDNILPGNFSSGFEGKK